VHDNIDIPHDMKTPTTFRGQPINDSPISIVYDSLKGTNIPDDKKTKLLNMVYKLKRNYYLSSKALQQCNLKNRYINLYISKYNGVVSSPNL
jgi:hypothetical protein